MMAWLGRLCGALVPRREPMFGVDTRRGMLAVTALNRLALNLYLQESPDPEERWGDLWEDLPSRCQDLYFNRVVLGERAKIDDFVRLAVNDQRGRGDDGG